MQTIYQVSTESLELFKQVILKKAVKHLEYYSNNDLKLSILKYLDKNGFLWMSRTKEAGCYASNQDMIFLNRDIVTYDVEDCVDVLLHECCHQYLRLINHTHNSAFKELCSQIGCSGNAYTVASNPKSELAQKVKKLMRLASSSNANEAQLAMLKADQLIQKYSLTILDDINDSEFVHISVGEFKRISTKMRIISNILKHYNVFTVFSKKRNTNCLEISGLAQNVEIAEYVYHFLDKQLDIWYKQANLGRGRGNTAGFFLGFLSTFSSKLKQDSDITEKDSEKALQITDRVRQEALNKFYKNGRVRSSSHSHSVSNSAKKKGEAIGRSANINPTVKSSGQQQQRLTK